MLGEGTGGALEEVSILSGIFLRYYDVMTGWEVGYCQSYWLLVGVFFGRGSHGQREIGKKKNRCNLRITNVFGVQPMGSHSASLKVSLIQLGILTY